MKKGQRETTDEEFVAGWLAGGTRHDVAVRLGLASVESLSARAKRMRDAGVNLPPLTKKRGARRGRLPGRLAGKVEKLNAMIAAAKAEDTQ